MTAFDLPAGVYQAVVSLASDGLGRMPATQVPAALRRAATFTPARRAKLVGRQIADVVAEDEEFRAHLAAQVRALVPELASQVESGDDVAAPDLERAAAVAYLLGADGWERLVDAARDADRARAGAPGGAAAAAAERLSAQLAQARTEARQQRDKLRAQVDALKADNATLRRTLGQTRADLKEARVESERTAEALEEVRRDAEVARRAAAAEARRLLARLAEVESESTATRRAARDDRDAEVVRLRLLLETVTEAATGLRRELALPASTGLPADAVEAVVPDASPASQVGRALLSDDPALLRRLLELPRVHLIVDGYNVSKEAWPSAPLEQQRTKLASGLAGVVAGKGIEVTVVFDGADLLHTPVFSAPRGVRVRFSPPGIVADDVVRQLVAAEPVGRPVVVVSTDREVAESVTKMGARSVASGALVALLGR